MKIQVTYWEVTCIIFLNVRIKIYKAHMQINPKEKQYNKKTGSIWQKEAIKSNLKICTT